jgi:hypothetical protein
MKKIYIATGVNEQGDSVQENAYADRDLAMFAAQRMCQEVNEKMGANFVPDTIDMDLYELGDRLPDTVTVLEDKENKKKAKK